MTTIGEALVEMLEAHGVELVFGIPGVHTIELYRGLAASRIRHVTPRHEQGAAFMADGYARASGRPGVAFVITGPGLTNTITAMAQARADSVPMLVISGVNRRETLGRGLGYLHELPDQRGLISAVALFSERVETAAALAEALARAFTLFATRRPGPVHIEVPLDVMPLAAGPFKPFAVPTPAMPDDAALDALVAMAGKARRPLILAGGGARRAGPALRAVADRLGAPVVTTVNGRGLMFGHPLSVPASPSLPSVRALIADADFVLAAGTELGPTDYDMYADGGFVLPASLARIDIDAAQLARHPASLAVEADCALALPLLAERLAGAEPAADGAARARAARDAARAELSEPMRAQLDWVETIRDTLPGSLIVGDSTQPVYAANLYYDHDLEGGWFNAATGFGALGHGPAAAIGASLARPDRAVVCLTGDGGFQFTLTEIASAVEAAAPVIFVVWNNHGYREIEQSMRDAGVEPVGVSPAPPDFLKLADAYGVDAVRVRDRRALRDALVAARAAGRVRIIDVAVA